MHPAMPHVCPGPEPSLPPTPATSTSGHPGHLLCPMKLTGFRPCTSPTLTVWSMSCNPPCLLGPFPSPPPACQGPCLPSPSLCHRPPVLRSPQPLPSAWLPDGAWPSSPLWPPALSFVQGTRRLVGPEQAWQGQGGSRWNVHSHPLLWPGWRVRMIWGAAFWGQSSGLGPCSLLDAKPTMQQGPSAWVCRGQGAFWVQAGLCI